MKKLKSLLEQTQYRSFDDGVRGELGFSKEQYPNDFDRDIARLEKIRNIKNNPTKYGFAAWDGSDTQQGSLSKLKGMEAATLKNLEKQFPKKFKAYSDLNRNKKIASGQHVVMSPAQLAKISGMNPEQATAAANRIGLSYSKYYDSLSDDERVGAKKKWVPFKIEDEFPDYKPTTESKNMKNSRKQLIENYVDLRCKKLMEDVSLNEQGWLSNAWNTVKDVGGTALKGAADLGLGYVVPGMQGAQMAYDMSQARDKDGNWSVGAAADKMLDRGQAGLDIAGMIPGVGAIPDAANVGISGMRAAFANDPDTIKKHKQNAALSSAALIPGAGLLAGGSKIAMRTVPKVADTVYNVSKAVKTSDPYKAFKTAKHTHKVDKHTGGHVGNTVNTAADATAQAVDQNVVQPVKASFGDGGFFSNMYNQYKNK